MHNPVSTYRIQFHKGYTFADFQHIIPYLKQLGINTVYASPVFASTPGSTHGYDGINPLAINPEIGTEAQFSAVRKELTAAGFSWLQDIVPNHMAFDPRNLWLMDVLEKGKASEYAPFFDIGWTSNLFNGRIMVPFLGASAEEVIRNGELKVACKDQRLVLAYFDSVYPLHLRAYPAILQAGDGNVPETVTALLAQIKELEQTTDAAAHATRYDAIKKQFAAALNTAGALQFVDACLKKINADPGKLQQIADSQEYALCHWQETDSKINFRRFFTVNGLISLNIHDPAVFRHFHRLIKTLLDRGVFQGLRVDHIDGLYDPGAYLEQLRELAGDDAYIVVEKILEPGEDIPKKWPIQGNSGYDFLGLVNNLLTDSSGEEKLTRFYQKLTNDLLPVHQQLRDKKAHILYEHMEGDLNNLLQLFLDSDLAAGSTLSSDDHETLRLAIGEFLIECPVYRFYGNRFPLEKEEAHAVEAILKRIRKTQPLLVSGVDLLEAALLEIPRKADEVYNARALHFYQRCMQFTGPLMAKGVEDTLMYTYNRFIGHNEVGDSPEAFGMAIDQFHRKMLERQEHWPLSINTTSTHDTKRGEDVRARLNVLTSLATEWTDQVTEWQQGCAGLKQHNIPDANDEYFIYQTITGAYPMPGQKDETFIARLQEYLVKALREAKRHSNWTTPNEAYEEGVKNFVAALLDPKNPFLESFLSFHRVIADFGIVNSLVQVMLKFTCPGIPDTYQGTELWDLSFVDPDNRRAVDFRQRQEWLKEMAAPDPDQHQAFIKELWLDRFDARIKLWLVQLLSNERKNHPDVFEKGLYVPLQVKGKYKENILAFARRYRQQWYVVVVPLYLAAASKLKKEDDIHINWKDTAVVLPPEAPEKWNHLLLHTSGKAQGSIAVKDIFSNRMPLALITLEHPVTERGAGILLHITSLPTAFGIGDFGPEAYRFARFLSNSRQKYWQLLPLTPSGASQAFSPYSSFSSMAGNTLLISPELLVEEGLLEADAWKHFQLPPEGKVDYAAAEKVKHLIFDAAFRNFQQTRNNTLMREFEQFCRQEAGWLDDFAVFTVLKHAFDGKAWFQWPEAYKQRQQQALEQFSGENAAALDKVKWLQYLFAKQWKKLKSHCNNLGIQLFGDLPFYVSYDSVDVWANPGIFSLDENGNMQGVAGVPPDYFNANGQLWGMPVFRWDRLKEKGYQWWIQRIRKNMELYDLLRLDHFRAFAAYWEVPAGEETAINGKWQPGPGADFFSVLEKELGKLPFVAEDLGDIDEPVYQLRDRFRLPGMKVLQFAFGDETPASLYIPHNYTPEYIAYTGTHDNNTTRGWFRSDADKATRKQLEWYTGTPVGEKEVHLVLGRMAYASVAKTVILPMQDVLGLDETARMNTPASMENNWLWCLQPGQLTANIEEQLRNWVKLFNR